MNAMIRWSLRHRGWVVAVAVLLSLGGAWLLRQLPVDVFPDLDRPGVTVMTHVPGLSPEETEARLTNPIEAVLKDLPGVDVIWSSSSIGLSHVHVVFGWNEDQEQVRRQVQERLGSVSGQLPAGASPVLLPFVSVMGEIELIGLSGASPEVLRRAADEVLRPRLLALHGVAQVLVIGGDVQELAVLVDPAALVRHGVSLTQVRAAVAKAGQIGIGGIIPHDNQEYLVRVLAPVHEGDLATLVVAPGLRLGELARIEPRAILKRGSAGIDGGAGVILSVYKVPGADSRALSSEVGAALTAASATLPAGVVAARLFRQSDFIQAAIAGVNEALREGGLLVVLVVILFLASLRASAITLTALPVSFLLTILLLWRFGLTLNTMTLGGLAIAVGQLVDDAVVDVENVWRRLRQRRGKGDPLEVIASASIEVRGSILYATLVVVLSVLPMALLSGIEGRLFRPLVEAYVTAVVLSLLVAITLTPALCALLLTSPRALSTKAADAALPRLLKRWVAGLLGPVLRWPTVPLIVGVLLAAGALWELPRLHRELLPPFNEGTLTVNLAAVPGITLPDSDKLGSLAEQLLLGVPEVTGTGRRTGRAELDTHSAGVHQSEIEVALKAGRPRAVIEEEIRARLGTLPGVVVYLGQPISHRLEHLLEGVNGQVIVRLYGDDPIKLRALGESARLAMAGVPGLVDLQSEKQLDIPELLVDVDRERAAAAGLNPGEVAQQAQEAIYGTVVGKVDLAGRAVDVRVRANDSALAGPAAIAALPVALPSGGSVPLAQVATLREAAGLDYLNRDGGRRVFLVMANVRGRDASAAAQDVQRALSRSLVLPAGYRVAYGGEWAAERAAGERILVFAALALVAVALALGLHFRAVGLTLLTLANIPLSLVGSVAALWFFHEKLSVAAALGFVAVCGIASRNTILLLGHYQHLMAEEGEPFSKALVVRGSLDRLTPMLMTALTAGLALVPWIVARHDPGREILGPVALVIAGGLVSSTLLDLLVTPAAFWLWGRRTLQLQPAIASELGEGSVVTRGPATPA